MSFRTATTGLPLRALPRTLLPRTPSQLLYQRFASSSASTISPLSATEQSLAKQLDWPTYLSLRKSQRLYGLVASVPTTLLGFFGGASYFATIESDPTELILGLQPVYIYGIATIACVAGGWLAGPILGSTVWKMVNRRSVKSIEAKDKDFFGHVVKNRADASRNSVANPIPDYYAEKVGSLKDYRHWLRDQRTFMRKTSFLTEQ
ncbi:Pam17p [Sporobolomyces salmoneus]|uniref:Pam17p n=1 Tax=Sporobolomyces salmoneus TaxID=183962 RepID=UPI00316BC3CC